MKEIICIDSIWFQCPQELRVSRSIRCFCNLFICTAVSSFYEKNWHFQAQKNAKYPRKSIVHSTKISKIRQFHHKNPIFRDCHIELGQTLKSKNDNNGQNKPKQIILNGVYSTLKTTTTNKHKRPP